MVAVPPVPMTAPTTTITITRVSKVTSHTGASALPIPIGICPTYRTSNSNSSMFQMPSARPGGFEPPPNHLQTDFVYPPQPKPPIVFKMMISVCIASITERELSAPLEISMANHEYRYQISLVAGSHDASRPSIICGVHIRV